MIQESELILNPDGSIYHLHLLPEQVAPLILTVGDPDRVSSVSRHFDAVEHRVRKREFVTHTGRIGQRRITVISTGIGTDNIDIVLNELDALFAYDLKTRQPLPHPASLTIIRLGTSGCIQASVPVDSLVATSGALGLDGLLHFYKAPGFWENNLIATWHRYARAKNWDFPAKPYYVPADAGLLAQFSRAFQPAITATNIGFYAPQGRRLRANPNMQDYISFLQGFEFQGHGITNLEMETSAIYGLGTMLGHRCLSLSAILANRANGTFSKQPQRVVNKMIKTALEIISNTWSS